MLWVILALMCLAAIGFTVWPLRRNLSDHGLLAGVAVLAVAGLSAGVYWGTGEPGVPSGAGDPQGQQLPDLEAMVTLLAERLEREPDDLEGWKMLGRSYTTMGNSEGAIGAWERAVEVSSGQDVGALVGLGEALLATSGQAMTPRSITLFENALVLEPNNPPALFWGGVGAFNRGDTALAADRWELLLGTNPPDELRPLIEQRIAEWRGRPVAPAAAAMPAPASPAPASPAAAPPAAEGSSRIVAASLSVDAEARAVLPADATVFIIARDPGQPSPPIAVTRRRLSELPMVVELRNGDSMMPGRELGNFDEFELVARVSLSGSPAAKAGDWFGSAIVRPSEGDEVDLAISRRVE